MFVPVFRVNSKCNRLLHYHTRSSLTSSGRFPLATSSWFVCWDCNEFLICNSLLFFQSLTTEVNNMVLENVYLIHAIVTKDCDFHRRISKSLCHENGHYMHIVTCYGTGGSAKKYDNLKPLSCVFGRLDVLLLGGQTTWRRHPNMKYWHTAPSDPGTVAIISARHGFVQSCWVGSYIKSNVARYIHCFISVSRETARQHQYKRSCIHSK